MTLNVFLVGGLAAIGALVTAQTPHDWSTAQADRSLGLDDDVTAVRSNVQKAVARAFAQAKAQPTAAIIGDVHALFSSPSEVRDASRHCTLEASFIPVICYFHLSSNPDAYALERKT